MRRFVLVGAGVFAPFAAAHAEVFPLEKLETNARNLAAEMDASVEQAEAAIARVQAADNPHLEAEATAGIRPGSKPIEVRDEEGDIYRVTAARDLSSGEAWIPTTRYGIGLTLTDALYDFGRTRTAEHAAKQTKAAAELGVKAAQERAAGKVGDAYLKWLGAVAQAEAAQGAVKDAQHLEELVGRLVQAGVRPASDREEARAEVARATLSLIQAEGEVVAARTRVALTSGVPLTSRDTPDVSMLTTPPEARPRTAPDIDALRARVAAAQAALDAAREADAALLGGKVSAGAYGSNILLFPAYEAGLSLTIPLWDGGAQTARERASAADLHAAQEALKAAEGLGEVSARSEAQKAADAAAAAELGAAEQWLTMTEAAIPRAEMELEAGRTGIEAVPKARATARAARLAVIRGQLLRLAARLGLDGG
jgi:outer membrane protein TolC